MPLERGLIVAPRTTATLQETPADSWSESKSQPRDERDLQECGHPGQLWQRTVPRFLCGFAGQRHEAGDGASDTGAQDRGHYVDTLEEGGTFRRRTTEDASSLSIE